MDENVKQFRPAFVLVAIQFETYAILERFSKLSCFCRIEQNVVHLLNERGHEFNVPSKGTIFTAYLSLIGYGRGRGCGDDGLSTVHSLGHVAIQFQGQRDKDKLRRLKGTHVLNHRGKLRK